MTKVNRILLAILLAATPLAATAQTNGSNSSYSRFGLGTMRDQSQTFNRAMGGVAQGLRSGKRVNMLNPASYSAIDSLSFIFDVGMSMQFGNMKQGGSSVNARNTTLNNVNAGARIARGLGLSFGFVPYSSIGYNFTRESKVGSDYTSAQKITTRNTYYGNGGIHELYVGLGWNPFAKLSIGANIGYLWGDYNHSLTQAFYEGTTSSTAYSSLSAEYSGDIKTYKADIGVQYPIRLTKRDWLTLGATVGIGHNTHNKASMNRYTSAGDTIGAVVPNAFQLPYTYSAGFAWQHSGKLIVAGDYTREQWSDCVAPTTGYDNHDAITLVATKGQYLNCNKVNLGVEYTKNPVGYNYVDHIQYRIGASYATPNVKIAGQKGPKEYGATIGLGLPLSRRTVSSQNGSNSFVNISAQWLRRAPSTSTMITENYFMLNLGITFHEPWFMKWKIN